MVWPLFGYMLLFFALPFLAANLLGLAKKLPWLPTLGALYMAGLSVLLSVLIVFLLPVAMLERVGGLGAYRRSRELLAGHWGLGLKVMLPILLTEELLVAAVRYLLPAAWMDQLARQLIEAASLPFETAAAVVLYLHVRAARESRDANELAGELDRPPV